MRTSKGHLVYKRPPARSQLRSRKPILRHACYNIHAAHMSSMNSRYYHITLQSTLYRLTHRAYKDHKNVINITSYNGSKLGLSTDKVTNGLEKPCTTNMSFHEGPDCCLELYYSGQRRASGG